MAEFNSGLPSNRQIQAFIKGQNLVEIKLIFGETISGKIRWQDSDGLGLVTAEDKLSLVRLSAIAMITPMD